MEILGRIVGDVAEGLYHEAMALSPAPILFSRMADSDLEIRDTLRGGCLHRGDGSQEILLADDADDLVIQHELIHALLQRRGFVIPTPSAGFGSSYAVASEAVLNIAQHAALYAEGKARKLVLQDWPRFLGKVKNWSLESEPRPSTEGGIQNAWRLAELICYCPLDTSRAVEHVKAHYPLTLALAEALAVAVRREVLHTPASNRALMAALLDVYERAILVDFRTTIPLRRVVRLTPVFLSEAQLAQPASRHLEVAAVPTTNQYVVFLNKRDGTLLGLHTTYTSSIPAVLKMLRDDLALPTSTYAHKYQVPILQV